MAALKLCILSSEMVPYAKTGGLADVAGALVRNLANLGHDVRAFMPLYPIARGSYPDLQPVLGAQRFDQRMTSSNAYRRPFGKE